MLHATWAMWRPGSAGTLALLSHPDGPWGREVVPIWTSAAKPVRSPLSTPASAVLHSLWRVSRLVTRELGGEQAFRRARASRIWRREQSASRARAGTVWREQDTRAGREQARAGASRGEICIRRPWVIGFLPWGRPNRHSLGPYSRARRPRTSCTSAGAALAPSPCCGRASYPVGLPSRGTLSIVKQIRQNSF
jgi:hypothetical protein